MLKEGFCLSVNFSAVEAPAHFFGLEVAVDFRAILQYSKVAHLFFKSIRATCLQTALIPSFQEQHYYLLAFHLAELFLETIS